MDANPTVDDVLRRYLLGAAAPEVREDVDRRLFSDDRVFWEQLCLVEDELIDDYVSGELDEDERERFEGCFLVSDERRERVEFARTLRAHAQEQHTRAAGWNPLPGWFFIPGWVAAAAALLLVVGPVVTWQLARPATPAADVNAWLSYGLVRTVGATLERVEVQPDAKLIRLRLEADRNEYPAFRATLHLIGGEEIYSQGRLETSSVEGREAVTVTVPAELLPSGDYYLKLHGERPGQTPVPLERYDFRVLR